MQGVGFRPFVYQAALAEGVSGWVSNTLDGVHVRFNAEAEQAARFERRLVQEAPALAVVTGHALSEVEGQSFAGFCIIDSRSDGAPDLMLTPDFALCDHCRSELFRAGDRREGYPFITCTYCGPRFSIVNALPYDRERTAMAAFDMCPECRREYDDPLDRRYYSQTNSCAACGVRLELITDGQVTAGGEAALSAAVRALQHGAILAVKGIGGYLLMADAAAPEVVERLRRRKKRPAKPFAVMYPDVPTLERDVVIPPPALDLLNGPVAPIVLLDVRPAAAGRIHLAGVAPGLRRLGVMLPYAPLHARLLQAFGGPLVATSGNVSGSPIVFAEDQARRELPQVADHLLSHNRHIVAPQDDSVVRFSPLGRRRIWLRRSRGLAPSLLLPHLQWPAGCWLATGASLKSTFGLVYRGNLYISQYLGDLDDFETQEHYRHTLDHFLKLFGAQPDQVLADAHPDYYSTQLAREMAEDGALTYVQHHLAHFAAGLGEHDLLEAEKPVMGVIWDGAGYGADRQIWGGEIFLYEDHRFRRMAHLPYFPHLAGDKMPREPRLSALALTKDLPEAEPLLRPRFSATEWRIYQQLLRRKGGLKTSSMGRLFDGVAALLGIADRTTYEGEAAMQLEQMATAYYCAHRLDDTDDYLQAVRWGEPEWTRTLIRRILQDRAAGRPASRIAAAFHYSLAASLGRMVREAAIDHVVFGGGVWQNGLLVDCVQEQLPDRRLYFPEQVSPNDESIALGQLIYGLIRKRTAAAQPTAAACDQ